MMDENGFRAIMVYNSHSFLQTITEFKFGNLVRKSRSKLGINGRVDVDTVSTDASLPANSEFANNSSCNKIRFVVNHVRNHDHHAPSIASSILASAKTMKGALPPASKDTLQTYTSSERHRGKKESKKTNFFKVLAAILYNSFATGVDPVKLTFLTILFSHISFPTSRTFFWVVTILMTPSGIPARRPSY